MHADPRAVPCWPCHRLHDSEATCIKDPVKNGAACISSISVDQLVRNAAAALGRR